MRLSEFEFEFMRGNFRKMKEYSPRSRLIWTGIITTFSLFLLYVPNDKNEKEEKKGRRKRKRKEKGAVMKLKLGMTVKLQPSMK